MLAHCLLLACRVQESGPVVLQWLHTLLLEPDSQLQLLFTDSGGVLMGCSGGDMDSMAARHAVLHTKIWAELPGSLTVKVMSGLYRLAVSGADTAANVLGALGRAETGSMLKAAVEAAVGAAAKEGLLPIKLAAVRAGAAYALLVVAIQQRRLQVVHWLLGRFKEQRAWRKAGHYTAEAVLVAQQRLAWSSRCWYHGYQSPLLLLASRQTDDNIFRASALFQKVLWTCKLLGNKQYCMILYMMSQTGCVTMGCRWFSPPVHVATTPVFLPPLAGMRGVFLHDMLCRAVPCLCRSLLSGAYTTSCQPPQTG